MVSVKAKKGKTEVEVVENNAQLSTDRIGESINNNQDVYKVSGTVTTKAADFIPPMARGILQNLSKQYNLPFDIGSVELSNDKFASQIGSLKKIVGLLNANSKLLPELLKLVKQVVNADLKLANFHKQATKLAMEHKTQLDRETADMFLTMFNYQQKSSRLESKVNRRAALAANRTQAIAAFHQGAFSEAVALTNAEYEIALSDKRANSAAKIAAKKASQGDRERLRNYTALAFTNLE